MRAWTGSRAAILGVKLKYIGGWNRKRRAVAAAYDKLFRAAGVAEPGPYPANGIVLPHESEGSTHVWHQYVIRCARRDALREFLASRRIGSEIYYPVRAAYAGSAEEPRLSRRRFP